MQPVREFLDRSSSIRERRFVYQACDTNECTEEWPKGGDTKHGGQATARRSSKGGAEQHEKPERAAATAWRSKEEQYKRSAARSLSNYRALCSVSLFQTLNLTPHLNAYQDLRRLPSRRGCLYPVAGVYPLYPLGFWLFSFHFSSAVELGFHGASRVMSRHLASCQLIASAF